MRIEEFLSKLSGPQRQLSKTEWMACCPAHDDSDPSLKVAEGRKGLVVRCYAGCTQEQIVAHIGLKMADLFYDASATPGTGKVGRIGTKRRSQGQKRKRIDPPNVALPDLADYLGLPTKTLREFGLETEEFPPELWRGGAKPNVPYPMKGGTAVAVPYFDEDGWELRRKYRFRLTGKPKYMWDKSGGGQPLYGLQRLEKAKASGALVLAEGESDTWALWSIGVPALGLPGASTKNLLDPEHLEGVDRVWLCPDRDEAGNKMAEQLTGRIGKLTGGRIVPKIVHPPSPHSDLTEWRKATGVFAEEFRESCKKAMTWSQLQTPLVRMSEIEAEEIDFIWEPYLPTGYLHILAGKPGHGKTNLATSLAAAVTTGSAPCGTLIPEPGPVILFTAEDDLATVIKPRLEIAGADIEQVFAFDFEKEDFWLSNEGVKRLDRYCSEIKPKLVVVDPIVSFLGGEVDMNRANEVRAVLRPVRDVAKRHDCAILVTAHVKKGEVAEAMDLVSGSVDFGAVVRSMMVIFRDPEDPPKLRSASEAYVMAHAKHNLTRPGANLRYRIEPWDRNPKLPNLVWVGESKHTTSELKRMKPDEFEAVKEAATFLENELATEPQPATKIVARARNMGITKKDLDAARHQLEVVVDFRFGFGREEPSWYWELPEPHAEEVPL